MPLLDHFRPPLSGRRHWHSFHNSWATYLAADLNRQLPEGYFAEANVQFAIEIDVAAFEESGTAPAGGWTPPEPTATIPFVATTDVIEVQVYAQEGGPRLAGAMPKLRPSATFPTMTRPRPTPDTIAVTGSGRKPGPAPALSRGGPAIDTAVISAAAADR